MWNKVGMARNAQGLTEAIQEIAELREEFYRDVKVRVKWTSSIKNLKKRCV